LVEKHSQRVNQGVYDMKKLNKLVYATICTTMIALSFGCGKQQVTESNSAKPSVFTTLPPIGNIIEQIGGEHVDVKYLIDSGQNPHLFEPSPRQVVALGKARAYFTTGLPLENTLQSKFKGNSTVSFTDITNGVHFRSSGEHSHDHTHTSACGGHTDPHIWLGHRQIKVVAQNIADQLTLLFPEFENSFRTNLKKFIVEIEQIHDGTKKLLAPYKGRTLTVFHPSFGYFTDSYGLIQDAIEVDGKAPAPKHFAELITKSKQNKTRVLFIQPQFNQSTAEAIARSIGAEVSQLNALAPDVRQNLREIAEKVSKALQKR